MTSVMNEVFPRCAVPGSSCRLLQLEATGARPVWAVLDAAGTRHFTGEITLHCQPVVRAWFNGGELYFAEREGDPGLADRLLAMAVLGPDDLAAGSVQLGAVTHLGRLFDRVPHLDRDRVELALEILTGEVVGEIADHVVDDITIASYRHHPSGVVKWQKRPTVVITQVGADVDAAAQAHTTAPAPLPAPSSASLSVDLAPTAEDEALVAEYEASMATPVVDELVIESVIETVETVETAVDKVDAVEPVTESLVQHEENATQGALEEPLEASVRAPLEESGSAPALLEHLHAAEHTGAELTEAEHIADIEHIGLDDVVEVEHVEPEASVDATDREEALASFERSFDQQLEAQLGRQFGQHLDQIDQQSAGQPMFELPVFDLQLQDVMAEIADEQPASDGDVQTDVPAAAVSDDEQSWAIDDRVDWQLDAAVPVAESASVDEGPVVEFDLQRLLQQNDPSPVDHHGSARAASPEESDDDIRAAVQAALAEIAAATRTGGDHEVPSILMQAALAADADTGLTSAPDLREAAPQPPQAALSPTPPPTPAPSPPPAPPAARPVLPARAPGGPGAPAAADEALGEGSEQPSSQEVPVTGGLRRLMGTKKT